MKGLARVPSRRIRRQPAPARWGLDQRQWRAVRRVCARLRALFPNGELKSLILYGSQVYGKTRPDSDIDLFLIYDGATPEQAESLEEFTTDLLFEAPRVHVMMFNPAQLTQQATGLGNLLLYNVAHRGVLLEGVPMPKFEINRREVAEAGIADAKERLKSAQHSLEGGFYRDAISRSYYAVLYAADAALATRGFVAKSHAGTNTLFSYHFIKKGLVDARFKGLFKQVEKARIEADYSHQVKFTRADAELWLERAMEFVTAIANALPGWLEER